MKFSSFALGLLIALGNAEIVKAQEIKNRSFKQQVVTNTIVAQVVERTQAEAERLLNKGLQQIDADNPQGAIEPSKAALELYQEIGDRAGAARAFTNLGLAYFDLEQYQQAVNAFQQALNLTTQLGNKKGMSVTQNFLNLASQKLRESQESQVTQNPASNPAATRNLAQQLDTEANQAWIIQGADYSLQKWQQALPLWRSLGDKEKEARTLIGIGNAQHRLGAYTEALNAYQSALPFYKKNDNQIWQSIILNNLGLTYAELGNLEKALENFQQALDISLKLEDLNGQAKTLQNMGIIYATQGDQQKAADTQREALALVRKESQKNCDEDRPSIVCPGPLERKLEEVQRGLQEDNEPVSSGLSLEEALVNATQAQNRRLEESRRQMLEEKKNPQTLTVEVPFTESYRLVKDCAVDMIRGGCLFDQPQWVQDKESEAAQLYAEGKEQKENDEYEAALQSFQKALKLYQESSNFYVQFDLLTDIGDIYLIFGLEDEAKTTFQEAAKTLENIAETEDITYEFNELLFKAEQFNNLGSLFQSQFKDDVNAQKYYSLAMVNVQYHLKSGFNAPLLISSVQQASDKYSTILKAKGEVSSYDIVNADIYLSRKDFQTYATATQGLGRTHLNQQRYEEAQKKIQESLAIAENIQDLSLIASASEGLGILYDRQNKNSTAKDYFQQALALSEKVGDRRQQMSVLYHWSILEKKEDNLQQAHKLIEPAIQIIEDIRSKIASNELRTTYFALVNDYYQLYIDILMELHQQNPNDGYDKKALEVSEQARARTLLELIKEGDIVQGIDPQLKKQKEDLEQQFLARTQAIQNLAEEDKQDQIEPIQQEISQLENQLQALETEIRQQNPEYARLTQVKLNLSAEDIQQKIVDDNTVLLSYWLGKDQSYLWLVTPTEITSYTLPPKAEIEAVTAEIIGYAQDAGWVQYPDTAKAANQKLSQMLLAPVANKLANKRLIVVADGGLQYLPFSLLENPQTKEFLIVSNELINLPSASTLDAIRSKSTQSPANRKEVAIFAHPVFTSDDPRLQNKSESTTSDDPETPDNLVRKQAIEGAILNPLPGTEATAQQILAYVPNSDRHKLNLGFDANRQAIFDPAVSQYRLIHLGTHGLFNKEKPEHSGIVLSLYDEQGNYQADGMLLITEVFNLNLPADLVVLAACNTVEGEEIKGEGIVGVTRGLMYAGAERVLMTLWDVDDDATAVFMDRFYQEMLENKLTPSAALRATQLWMQTESEYQAPDYWAGFVLQGEWQ